MLRGSQAFTGLRVGFSGRAKNIHNCGATFTCSDAMWGIRRRVPEVSFLHGNFVSVLDPHALTLQQVTPLFFWMAMNYRRCAGGDLRQREHDILAEKDVRRHAILELTRETVFYRFEIPLTLHCLLLISYRLFQDRISLDSPAKEMFSLRHLSYTGQRRLWQSLDSRLSVEHSQPTPHNLAGAGLW